MEYVIEFSPNAREHLREYKKRDQQIIIDAIEARLRHEPVKRSRNRKPLEDNPLAPWELRVGKFRIFYDFDAEDATVVIIAIGHKVHNRLVIAGEEVEL